MIMEITLNHTIVPSHDNVSSAKFYSRIFGFEYVKEWGPFAVLKVNSTLTFDFMDKDEFQSLHYAFKVDDQQFDEIFERIKLEVKIYGSGPSTENDGKINNDHGGRGVYFRDLDHHLLEIITTDYIID